MKMRAKAILQRVLGLHAYLVIHSLFVALTMPLRAKEGDVRQFIARLKPDDTVLDVGANIGTMTLLFARRCPRGRILAFEPIPDNHAALLDVLRIFRVRNAEPYPLGVGERDETLRMVMPNAGQHVRMTATCHVIPEDTTSSEGEEFRVRSVALDEFTNVKTRRIAAIKIDVEDHERFVLRGARGIIERDRPLIYCEMWSPENKTECLALMDSIGYGVFVASGTGLEPYDANRHAKINYFFVPDERRAEFGVRSAEVVEEQHGAVALPRG